MAPYQPVPENGYSPGHAPAYNPGFQPSYDLGPGYEKTQPNVKVDTMETMISVASQKDIRMKRRIRRLRAALRALNLALSIVVLGIMLNTYLSFLHHRTQTVAGQTYNLYPVDPILWPTYMMLVVPIVSFLFNLGAMSGYLWGGVEGANRVSMYQGYWNYVVSLINVVMWAASSSVFMRSQGPADANPPPRDIWGWTCSNAVDELSQHIKTAVNFDTQCTTQTNMLYVSIVTYCVDAVGLVVTVLAFLRMRHKKKLRRMQEQYGQQ